MKRMNWTAALAAALAGLSTPAFAGGTDTFTIGYEEAVSNGVPGPGAGNIESVGATDVYHFEGTAGDEVYFDRQGGGCGLRWECRSPSNVILFNDVSLCGADPGVFMLAETGTYEITAYSAGSGTGTYSFEVWENNPPEFFDLDLEQLVEDGFPAAGAGSIEEPASLDVYTLAGMTAGSGVYFDRRGGGCALRWDCEAPDGSFLFMEVSLCGADPGEFILPMDGDYTIYCYSSNGSQGTYSFEVWEVDRPDVFAIGYEQEVSDGFPGPGAGNIEEPASQDIYTFNGLAGDEIYVDRIGGGCALRWDCRAPDGAMLFQNVSLCGADPGAFVLDQDGEYEITCYSSNGGTGTYTFNIWTVNRPEVFPISYEQEVSDGSVGAGSGNIEEPAAVDLYEFTGAIGDEVYFDRIGGGCGLNWSCQAPDGSFLFQNTSLCGGDPGYFLLDQAGTYTIICDGDNSSTGTYTFDVWAVNPDDVFTISLDEIVSDGVPGAGAGNIEEPATSDVYMLDLEAGDLACFERITGGCSLDWSVEAPDGSFLFQDVSLCGADPGKFEIAITGTYIIRAYGPTGGTGTYSIVANTGKLADFDGNCVVNTNDLLELLGGWGTIDGDLNGDGNTDVSDLLILLGEWG